MLATAAKPVFSCKLLSLEVYRYKIVRHVDLGHLVLVLGRHFVFLVILDPLNAEMGRLYATHVLSGSSQIRMERQLAFLVSHRDRH